MVRETDTISRQVDGQTEEWKYESVKALDEFTKVFCRDKQVNDELVFRCHQCEFEQPDRKCLVKVMARNIFPNYKNFGSMGDM